MVAEPLGDVLDSADRAEAARAHRVPLTLKIRRYNPEVRGEESWWDEFEIEADPDDRLLDALHQVKWYHDGTLALRRSCAHGICGSDAMVVNGKNRLACKILVRDVVPNVTVEPIRGLHDVVPDLLGRRRLRRAGRHRERAPVHLRLARRGRARPTEDPVGEDGR